MVIIGDAAHFFGPETGVSSGIGLGDAHALAQAIAQNPDDPDAACRSYEMWRAPAVRPYEANDPGRQRIMVAGRSTRDPRSAGRPVGVSEREGLLLAAAWRRVAGRDRRGPPRHRRLLEREPDDGTSLAARDRLEALRQALEAIGLDELPPSTGARSTTGSGRRASAGSACAVTHTGVIARPRR